MKKTILLIIVISFMNFHSSAQVKTSKVEIEVEKWTKELIQNGQLFHCYENEKVTVDSFLKNILSSESDFNKDGIKDGLFYFHYDSCGGTINNSDIAMLVYSKDGHLITDKSITQTVENKIKNSLTKIKISKIEFISIRFKGLGETIVGNYSAWIEDDSNCCPSSNGTFEYDLDSTFPSFKIKNIKE